MALPTTREEIHALGIIDPEFAEILEKQPYPDLVGMDLQDLREGMRHARLAANEAAGVTGPPKGISEEDMSISARDGFQLRVRVYRPTSNTGGPLVVLFHGGGFIIGEVEWEEPNAHLFVENFDAVIVSVDYRMPPHHVFPTAINDCWDATKWAAENASKLGADVTKGFIVAGSSSGGRAANVVACLARDEKLSPPVTGQFLVIPGTCEEGYIPGIYADRAFSYEQCRDAPMLNWPFLKWMADNYKQDPTSPLQSSLLNPNGHTNLPPAFFQICGMDPLRDEALIYEGVLREAGVKTNVKLYPGLPHGWWAAWPQHSKSPAVPQDAKEGFAWLLSQQ